MGQTIVERQLFSPRVAEVCPPQPAWRLSQESQDNVVHPVDISGQTRHLSHPSSNLFDFSMGIYAKKYEKTQLKPFECGAKIDDQKLASLDWVARPKRSASWRSDAEVFCLAYASSVTNCFGLAVGDSRPHPRRTDFLRKLPKDR